MKVEGSGHANMSLSSMRVKPSIDEPSKGIPSSKACPRRSTGTVIDFRLPRMSVNQVSTKRTFRALISLKTAFRSLDIPQHPPAEL